MSAPPSTEMPWVDAFFGVVENIAVILWQLTLIAVTMILLVGIFAFGVHGAVACGALLIVEAIYLATRAVIDTLNRLGREP